MKSSDNIKSKRCLKSEKGNMGGWRITQP